MQKLTKHDSLNSPAFQVQPGFLHTFPFHAHGQALLVAAVLAAVALAFVDQTLFVIPAGVSQVFTHSSFEEAFASLTAVNTIVFPFKMKTSGKKN